MVEDAYALANGTGGGYITVHPKHLGNPSLVWQMMIHEVGHLLNFHHLTVGSPADSSMFYRIDPNGPFYGITCADVAKANRTWRSFVSPVMLNLSGGAMRLCSADDGVFFDIGATGTPVMTAWPAMPEDVALLVLDRNGNGQIDSGRELFGNRTLILGGSTLADNGFQALAELDDNFDGWIDSSDAAYRSLRLWFDVARDGIADPSELRSLEESEVSGISVNPQESPRVDRWGNAFRYGARVLLNGHRVRYAWDVFLVYVPN